MKILIILLMSVFILIGCGNKSDIFLDVILIRAFDKCFGPTTEAAYLSAAYSFFLDIQLEIGSKIHENAPINMEASVNPIR